MKKVDQKNVRGWTTGGSIKIPTSVNENCPFCHHVVNFGGMNSQHSTISRTTSLISSCHNCKKVVRFICIKDESSPEEVYMFPSGGGLVTGVDIPDSVPEPLRRAYDSTLKSYNAGIYTATAVTGRRTLEGIFKYLLPRAEHGASLFRMIEMVTKANDLSSPLMKLAHAIRDGGNLGAHFDEEREPDADVARKIVELLGFLIEYLYFLPEKIELLEKSLSSGDAAHTAEVD